MSILYIKVTNGKRLEDKHVGKFCVTRLQQHWLNTRGDRTLDDIIVHNDNLFVKYNGDRLYEIPTDGHIRKFIHKYFSNDYIRNAM